MDPQFETTRFRVEGMDCASCITKVDTATRRIAGVEDVSVSVVNQTVTGKQLRPAILADTGATVLVTINAMRLLGWHGSRSRS